MGGYARDLHVRGYISISVQGHSMKEIRNRIGQATQNLNVLLQSKRIRNRTKIHVYQSATRWKHLSGIFKCSAIN